MAGVTVPMGVASLSEEACSRTAGSGNINSCGICEAFANDLRLISSNITNQIQFMLIMNAVFTIEFYVVQLVKKN